MSAPDPRAELAALAHGLAAHARRRGRAGLRRVALEPPASGPDPAPPGRGPEAGARATSRGPGPDRPTPDGAPPAAPPAAPRPAPGPGPARIADAPAASPPAAPTADPAELVRRRAAACKSLDELRAAVADCTACPLHASRKQTVFADGEGTRGVLFVGEAPGASEDAQGVPFVGRAGALLTDIIRKGMGLERRETTIANVLKCRPPANRDPSSEEKRICTGWLDRQIELLRPRLLIALGRHAAGHLLASDAPMGRMRGRVHERGGRRIVATYHPAFLLRSPEMKKPCWQDIQLAMGELGLEPPSRSAAAPPGPDGPRGGGPRP